MDLKSKYSGVLMQFANLPDYNRMRAENRFLFLREFEEVFAVKEKIRLGEKYRIHAARRRFCKIKGVSISTFLRWRRLERDYGIQGLISHYGGDFRFQEGLSKEEIRVKRGRKHHKFFTLVEIDTQKPYACIKSIKDMLESHSEMSEYTKRAVLAPFKFILSFSRTHLFYPQDLLLTTEEIKQLEKYRKKTHRNHWAKATALLMANQHHTLFEIAVSAGRSLGTIFRWLRQYEKNGLDFIVTKMAEKRRRLMWEERTTRVIDILHTPPKAFNINRTSWTYKTIIQAYNEKYGEWLGKQALQKIIKSTNYTWRHARKVLTSHDPDYKDKVNEVLNVLRNTKENEAFFFVDELGPYRVKKYGGKALVSRETTRTIPGKQKSKGQVTAIAALEAFTNQLTWKFIKGKDAESIILLLEMLREKYREKDRLFITWDTLSTHNSGAVKGWFERNNKRATKQGTGPTLHVTPLPSKSQFLNVIESVFGGMKKAVIHNSDYSSKKEMEIAMNRHFEERNIYFQKNPKRVGNKIWDKEKFDTDKLRGGLFKKM
jgi:transposase